MIQSKACRQAVGSDRVCSVSADEVESGSVDGVFGACGDGNFLGGGELEGHITVVTIIQDIKYASTII